MILCGISILATHLQAGVVTAKRSDDFVDSMGINIKLDRSQYNNNWGKIKPRLQDLGIWHYRDGLPNVNNSSTFRSRYQSLYNESGLRGLFIWGPNENQNKTGPQAVGAAKKGLDYVKFISGANEPDLFWPNNYDNNSSTNIWQEVRNYQNAMYDALKADSATDDIIITTPPLSTYALADDLGNAGNIKADKLAWHWYTGQGNPDKNEVGTGINATKSGLRTSSFPTSDIFTTESGHNSWKTAKPGNGNNTAVNEVVQMRYNVRILADQFRRGIKRTYLHQLMDLGTDSNNFNNSWGIVRADSNKTPKPAYNAWKAMVTLFKERTWNSSSKSWNKPSFNPGTLDYTITGSTNSVRNVLLQKSNNDFYMLIWVAADSWNESQDTGTTVNRSINVNFANSKTVTRQTFNNSGDLTSGSISSSNSNKTWSLTASTTMSILKITSGGGGSSTYSRLENKQHNKWLKANGSSANSDGGAYNAFIDDKTNTGDATRWKEISAGSPWVRLENKARSRWLRGNKTTDTPTLNAYVVETSFTGDATRWRFIDAGSGYKRIEQKEQGKWLKANGSTNKPAPDGGQWNTFIAPTSNTGDATKWKKISAN